MSFRQFGGMNYASKHNIVSSNYNTSNNLLITQNTGQPNSYINFESDISGNGFLNAYGYFPGVATSTSQYYTFTGSYGIQNNSFEKIGTGVYRFTTIKPIIGVVTANVASTNSTYNNWSITYSKSGNTITLNIWKSQNLGLGDAPFSVMVI